MHLRFLAFIFFIAFKASATVVVTDVDDTLRKTESLVPEYAVTQYLISPNGYFNGMKNLLSDLKQASLASQLFYVTDNYREVYDSADWLKSNNFPEGEVYQRENIASVLLNTKDYHKQKKINELLQRRSNTAQPFLFIGDNGYDDPGIYQKIAASHKDLDYKILIRDIKGETIFVGMLTRPQEANGPVYIFSGEYEFWFDLKYNFLVEQSSLQTWFGWYSDWLNRNAVMRSTATYMARKLVPAYCKGERKGACANQVQNQIARSIAARYRSLF